MCLNGRETNARVITELLISSRTWNCVSVPGAASNLWWPSLWSPGLQGLPPSPGHQAWEEKALGDQGGATKAKLPGSLGAGRGQMAMVGWISRKIHVSPLLVQRHLRQNHGFVALLQRPELSAGDSSP